MLAHIKNRSQTLYEIFEEIDPDNFIFNSKKLKNGVTFLFPHDNYIEEIRNALETDENLAIDVIRCLILTEFMPSPSNWHSTNITNMHNKCIDVAKVSGKMITLGNDAVLERSNTYANEKIAIYNVKSGIVTKGKRRAPRKQSKPVTNRGKLDGKIRENLYNLLKSAQSYRSLYTLCLNYVGSFIKYIKKNNEVLYKSIGPYLDYCPIASFFILFEPFKGAKFFIDTEIINAWYNESAQLPKNAKSLLMNIIKTSSGDAYANPSNYKQNMQDLIDEITDQKMPSSIIDAIDDAYNTFVNNNEIGDMYGVVNVEAHEYMKTRCSKSYNLKLFQDELRIRICTDIENSESPDTVINNVRDIIKLLPQLNDTRTVNSQTNSAFIINAFCFINSRYFLYLAPTTIGQFKGVRDLYINASPNSDKPIDPIAYKIQNLQSISDEHVDMEDLVANMKQLIQNGERIPVELYNMINPPDDDTS